MRTFAVALGLALLLAGCGGGSNPAAPATKPPAKATPAETATAKPAVAVPTGKPAPEALSSFRCAPDAKGRWNAAGYLTNSGKAKVTYQVTIYVGEASGGAEDARTAQVLNVAPGGSVKFSIRKVPAPKAGGPCHVQVLAGG